MFSAEDPEFFSFTKFIFFDCIIFTDTKNSLLPLNTHFKPACLQAVMLNGCELVFFLKKESENEL